VVVLGAKIPYWGDVDAQTRFETTFKQFNDLPLLKANTFGSGEDRMQLNDLMVLCTKLQKQVLDLEKAKSDQAIEIASLKKRVRIKQKSQENGQKRTNTDTRTEEHAKSREEAIKSKTSLKPLIGQFPTKDATWIVKKAQGMKLFTLESLSEEA
ncbi:hypothetical protein Tco_0048089, partial [Tanacetum coccineum]